MMPALPDAVAAACERHGLLPPGARVLVAVSGGPDSCVLLDVMSRLAEPLALHLTVVHFHHGVRGAAADADAEFVAHRAEELGLSCLVGVGKGLDPDEGTLRDARYAWFADAALGGATHVAVGHTRDDQAETVMLHLLRGTGLPGLSGMRPARPLATGSSVQLIRPLLDVARDDVLVYARELHIAFREDASNGDTRYRRNLIRRELMPALRAIRPDADARIAGLADLLAADDAFLEDAAHTLRRSACASGSRGWETFDRPALAAAPRVLLTRLLRDAYRDVLGAAYPPGAAAVTGVADALAVAGSSGAADWPGGVRVRWDADRVTVLVVPRPSELAPRPLHVPGMVEWPATAQCVRTRVVPSGGAERLPPVRNRLLADLADVPQPLVVRGWRPGDVWHPRGRMRGERVVETLRRQGVPVDRRPAVPVVASDAGVWWVTGAGEPASAAAAGTGTLLELEVTAGSGASS